MPKGKQRKRSFKERKFKTNGVSEGHAFGNGAHNDPAWDKKYPALVQAASSIIFNTRYGSNYNVVPGYSVTNNNNAIPGVVGVKFRFTLAGKGTDADPINVCSKNLYSYIRHANSGSANYESSDLMQYVIAVLGAATQFEQAKRDLRLTLTYSPINTYVYRAVLVNRGYTTAMIDDMIANNANYVTRLNILAAKLNTFKIPRDFSIFDRFSWMATNLFKDDELDKATYYYYKTDDFVHYDWANRTVECTLISSMSSFGTFGAYLDAINHELDNLLAYEDIGIMIGDILKAYKQEGCRVWSSIQLGEVQDSSYSPEVLYQIKNLTTYNLRDKLTIRQVSANSQLLELDQISADSGITSELAPGRLISMQFYDSNLVSGWNLNSIFNPILVENSNEPTNDDVITSTRNVVASTFKQITLDDGNNCSVSIIDDYFVYLCTGVDITRYNSSGILINYSTQTILLYPDDTQAIADENNIFKIANIVSKFPTLYRVFNGTDVDIFTDGKNNLVVTAEWLKSLHTGCTMSELSLPMFKLLESN